MKIWNMIVVLATVAMAPLAAMGQGTEAEKYINETYRTRQIAPSAAPLIAELQEEAAKILAAGKLAPLRIVYADILEDPYFMYWQPGRIITTLAYAYPHLTPEQQQAVKRYVQSELADETRAPWSVEGFIAPDNGARRELHSYNETLNWSRYWGMWGNKKPLLSALYGLWLYGDRSGDWATIRANYPKIAEFYRKHLREGELYGTIGAHIAMMRIARVADDTALAQSAGAAAAGALEMARDFAEVERRTEKYFKERYGERQAGYNHAGWMFLELAPEVGRFMAENVREPVLERNAQGLERYPLFWLRDAPYFCRWTGDEGVGIPTEMMGMVVPVERWVAGASHERLAGFVRSTPTCIGDCYWIEALVHAIESAGQTSWEPVK